MRQFNFIKISEFRTPFRISVCAAIIFKYIFISQRSAIWFFLYISYISNFFRSAAIAFNYFTALFLYFSLGIPNNIYTYRKAFRGENS
jgi:hypothetical protein